MDILKKLLLPVLSLVVANVYAQHTNKIHATLDDAAKAFSVEQEITFTNTGTTTLSEIIFSDWNNAYSGKETPLAKRFSDEFVWAFHRARQEERGITTIHSVAGNGAALQWSRPATHPDLVAISLAEPLQPGQQVTISINYTVKIPADRFTRFGYDDKGNYHLRDWYLTPARFENNTFTQYSNENLDDIANATGDYNLTLTLPPNAVLTTDLDITVHTPGTNGISYQMEGKSRNGFSIIIEKKKTFEVYGTGAAEISCNLDASRTTEIQRALLIDKISGFIKDNLGQYPYRKIVISQTDYDRNPVYGLNQLPAFLSPFPDSFLFELRFLKTYLNVYLKNTLKLDPRKDSWIYNGMHTYLMMQYLKENHPDKLMTGAIGKWKIFKGYHLFNTDFNEQYTFFYLLMARKNLDQPPGDPKDTFIKFNEQIAGRYKAGAALRYLDDYIGSNVVPKTLAGFYAVNLKNAITTREDFQQMLSSAAGKDIRWFFEGLIDSRRIIDYHFGEVKEEHDSLTITVKNRTGFAVPVPLYAIKDGKVRFRQWLENISTDSTFTIARQDADRLVLNYDNTVPEYNSRNNWHRLGKFFPNNRPLKFTFFQDIENPRYNQMFFVPSFSFNLYDGFAPGLRLHNKTLLLERPIVFDVNPAYSTKTGSLTGGASFLYNQYRRESNVYNIRYMASGSTYHYAPDARYVKFTPSVQFRIRKNDLRSNFRQYLLLRQVTVNRQQSDFVVTDDKNQNYSVFNARFSQVENEAEKTYSFYTDTQFANSFGKLSGEVQFRKLFSSNRQVNLRLFTGTFLYRNTNSDFFSFGLDRVSDYLFDYGLYGRSETAGLFSRQFVLADGGFKSQFREHFANQWMTTLNASFNIWNWVEVYGDAGVFSSTRTGAMFKYDSGVRLNLVPDYFELYFPVYSSNGWEFDSNYSQKIRFVVTLHPSTLISLFTRRWF